MRNLGFADNSFGGVWSFDSSSHIPKEEIGVVLSEAHRVLKPGGSIYVNTLVGDGSVDGGAIGRVQRWRHEEFGQRLRDAGFRITALRPVNQMGASTFIAQTTKD
jgi:SAM-dependent methyltransferase